VLLRDGSTGNTVIFKPTKEDPKVREAFFTSFKRAYFERTKNHKVTDAELAKLSLPDKMNGRLKTDPRFRAEMAAKYKVKGEIPVGEQLISSEFGYQTDKNGFYFDYKYSAKNKMQIEEIVDQDKTMSLKFTWRQDKVTEVVDNRSFHARYAYDGIGNLTQVTDSNSQTYFYKYENKKFPHLLSRIEYPSENNPKEKAVREIRYDDNGLVTFHRDKDGSETNYTYGKNPSDPENNFWTKSVRKGKGINEETYDEYQIKLRADGSRYLYRQENRQSGATSVTLFSSCCGKPLQITKNGEVTNFKYYENGLLKERISPKEAIRLEYDPRWKKVSKVSQNELVSQYEYDARGNLVRASNRKSEKVQLKYDKFGRILEMTDSEGKKISFKYGEKGKPVLITEKGVGTIRIDYDNEGRIRKTETLAQNGSTSDRKPSDSKSQEVVRRVMKGFQQLLDIIRPAGVGMSNT
jgi:YD repeat-containing protein